MEWRKQTSFAREAPARGFLWCVLWVGGEGGWWCTRIKCDLSKLHGYIACKLSSDFYPPVSPFSRVRVQSCVQDMLCGKKILSLDRGHDAHDFVVTGRAREEDRLTGPALSGNSGVDCCSSTVRLFSNTSGNSEYSAAIPFPLLVLRVRSSLVDKKKSRTHTAEQTRLFADRGQQVALFFPKHLNSV